MRAIFSPFDRWFLLGVIIPLVALLLASQDAHASLTATQSILMEYKPKDGTWNALGTLALDLALGPRWHLTYIHDRGWQGLGRWQEHDVSVTRVLWRDTTATMGVRRKIPEDESKTDVIYGLVAWRWGGR